MKTKGILVALNVLLILVLAWGRVLGAAQIASDAAPTRSPAEMTVELVGHLGGDSQGIVVAGNYGYTTLGWELAVLDLSDPTNPTRVGYTMLPVAGDKVDVEGSYAYVLGYLGALSQIVVVDVSAPTQPTIVASLAIAGFGLDVSGQYAYVAGDSFQVVDISDPVHPNVIGSCATQGVDVYVAGSYAYVAGGYNGPGLQVVNVANPTAPFQEGAAPASATGVFAAGGYAYVTDYTSTSCDLRVFDVSNPGHPQQVGVEELFTGAWSEAHDVHVAGNYAYVAGSAYIGGGKSYGGIDVVDVSDPAAPHSVGDYVDPAIWETTAVYVASNYAYLSAGSDGLRVMNVVDPTHPTEVGAMMVCWGNDILVSATALPGSQPIYAYLADWGLGVVDVSNPAYPVGVGRYQAPPPNYGDNRIDLAGPYVCISDIVGILRVMDASDPAQPVVVGVYQTSIIRDLDVDEAGDYAYLAAGDPDDLFVLDLSDPTHVAPVGAYDLPAEPNSVYIWGDHAYVGDDDGLWVLDISDPAHPAEQGHLDITGGVQDVQVHGQYAYVLNIAYSGGSPVLSLLAADIGDPAHPSVAGTGAIATGQWGDRLYVSGDPSADSGQAYAYVAGDDLWVLDISDPASPTMIATYITSWAVDFSGVYAAGEYIYAVGNGLYILQLSTLALKVNPASITWLAEAGGSDPPSRQVSIQSTGQPLTWTAYLSPTVSWLEAAPLNGITPAILTATAHISGLGVGQQTTTLVIEAGEGALDSLQVIPVTLIVAEEIHDVYLPLVLRQFP
jgi:hypothetical protein